MSFSEWATYKLGELVEEKRGISYGIVQPGEFLSDGGVPILKVNNLTEGKYGIKDVYRVKNEVEAKYERTRLKGNEILLSLVGSLGHVFRVRKEQIGWNVVRAIGVLPIKKEFNRDWIFWYMTSPEMQTAFKNLATHTVQATLNLKELKEISIPIPPEHIQDKISSILSSLDDKIELNRQTNQTLEAIAQAIFKEWFVDFNFPGATGALEESELGMIPKGWRVGKLGDLCAVQNGFAFKSTHFLEKGNNRVIKIKNISGNIVDIDNTQFISDSVASNTDQKFMINKGDLLIAMTGAEVGKIGLVPPSEQTLWLNQRVGSFKEKLPHSNLYLYLLLSSDEYQSIIQNSALGSAQPNISGSSIENIKCINPDKALLIQYGKIVSALFEKVLENISQNRTLIQLRDTLLPKLMKGELQINS